MSKQRPAEPKDRTLWTFTSGLTCVVDTREPHEEANDHPDAVFRPRVFAPGQPRDTPYADRLRLAVPVVRAKLDVGDYSLPGLETRIAIERKSGPDLLGTLFGDTTTALGERAAHLERFRAEIARAYVGRYELFAIVCEASVGWLFAEAARREERRQERLLRGLPAAARVFDPFAVLAILRSFEIDLACPTVWCGSKGLAELHVGETLARVWEQATGGPAAAKAEKRGHAVPWLRALKGAA